MECHALGKILKRLWAEDKNPYGRSLWRSCKGNKEEAMWPKDDPLTNRGYVGQRRKEGKIEGTQSYDMTEMLMQTSVGCIPACPSAAGF